MNLIVGKGGVFEAVARGNRDEAKSSGQNYDICHDQWLRKGRTKNLTYADLSNKVVRVPNAWREYFCGGSTRKTITIWDNSLTPAPNVSGESAYFFPVEGQCRAETVSNISAIDSRFAAGNVIRYCDKVNWRAVASDIIGGLLRCVWSDGSVTWAVAFNTNNAIGAATIGAGEIGIGDDDELPMIGSGAGRSFTVSVKNVVDNSYAYAYSDGVVGELFLRPRNAYRCDIDGNSQDWALGDGEKIFFDLGRGLWAIVTASGKMTLKSYDGYLYFGDAPKYDWAGHGNVIGDIAYGDRYRIINGKIEYWSYKYRYTNEWTGYWDNSTYPPTYKFEFRWDWRYRWDKEDQADVTAYTGAFIDIIDDSVIKGYDYNDYNKLGVEMIIGSEEVDFDSYDNNIFESAELAPAYNAVPTYASSGFVTKETRADIHQTNPNKVALTLEKGEYLLYCSLQSGIIGSIIVITNWRVAIIVGKDKLVSGGDGGLVSEFDRWFIKTVWAWDALGNGLNCKVWFCRHWLQLIHIDVSDDPPSRGFWETFFRFVIIVVVVAIAAYSAYTAIIALTQLGAMGSVLGLAWEVAVAGAKLYNAYNALESLSGADAPESIPPTYDAINSASSVSFDYGAATNPFQASFDFQRYFSF
ncbi:MAG: hypothetical protein LBF86_03755 [Helicobacteraceae bacterium]|jgi:hypothetical protein|nr:hypothetical protein [Helicobacteraceae bacterium]